MNTIAIKKVLKQDNSVKFAYLFGSSAKGRTGPLSDLDVAVYLAEGPDHFEQKLRLMERLARAIKSDRLDLVVANEAPILLKFEMVKNGIVLKDDPPLRIEFETCVLREYLDTSYLRETQRRHMRHQIEKGEYFGQA